MAPDRFRLQLESLLEPADIRIGGDRPWDIELRNPDLCARVLGQGTLGAGEAYMDGWWECDRLDEMAFRVSRADLLPRLWASGALLATLRARLVNLQKGRRAFVVGRRHYDLGNDLYESMLDRRMIYSCGYWRSADTLEEAQEAKLELIGRKLQLEPGMRVLDIGCGWGGSLGYLVERFDVRGVGITVSAEQARHARENLADLPIEIRLQDYREVAETFDRVLSVGMFEHVGVKNYRRYFQVVRRCLAKGGLFLLQTIGNNASVRTADPWMERYIFPNSMLPSASQIAAASEGVLMLEDWHGFGPDYDPTLMTWHANFTRAWAELARRYDERFRRMWSYYLLTLAGVFRARVNQLWQIVFSRDGLPCAYRPPGIR